MDCIHTSSNILSISTPDRFCNKSDERRSLMSEGISLALLEVEVATEVVICLTGWATAGLETMPMASSGPTKSVNWFSSSRDSSCPKESES